MRVIQTRWGRASVQRNDPGLQGVAEVSLPCYDRAITIGLTPIDPDTSDLAMNPVDTQPASSPQFGPALGILAFLLGVVGPVLFIILEYKTHCLSGCLFDPMPTRWHFILLVMVPLAYGTAFVGAYWRAPWIKDIAQFLWWPALLVPVYYSAAIGLKVQAFALLFSPFFIGDWAMRGFAWPSSGPEMLSAESTASIILIIVPALALGGWICLMPLVVGRADGISWSRLRWLWLSGTMSFVVVLLLAELPMVRTYQAIDAYVKGNTQGEVPPLLLEDSRVAMVSRLYHAPMQFSSDGIFDCEGPVDVFGPAVRMMNDWTTPTEMWNRSFEIRHSTGEKLLDQIKALNPAADTSPRAWRRLSQWERSEIKYNKDSKHLPNRK